MIPVFLSSPCFTALMKRRARQQTEHIWICDMQEQCCLLQLYGLFWSAWSSFVECPRPELYNFWVVATNNVAAAPLAGRAATDASFAGWELWAKGIVG